MQISSVCQFFFHIVLNNRNHLSELDSSFYFAHSWVTLFLSLVERVLRWLLGKNFFYEPKDSALKRLFSFGVK